MPYTPIAPPVRRTGNEMRERWKDWGRHPDHSLEDYVSDHWPYQSYWDWVANMEYEYRLEIYSSCLRPLQQEKPR